VVHLCRYPDTGCLVFNAGSILKILLILFSSSMVITLLYVF
jgi:hypothetical protein